MNPNRGGYIWACFAMLIVSFIWLIIPDVITIGDDVLGYAIDVVRGQVPSDWGSVLFLHEFRLMAEGINLLLPKEWWASLVDFCMAQAPGSFDERMRDNMEVCADLFPAFGAINLFWLFCIGLLCVSLWWLFRKLAIQDKSYVVSLGTFCLFLLFVRHYHYFYFHKYVDAYFTCFSLVSVVLLYAASLARGKKRLLLYACFFVALLHAVLYRKNACLILPAFLYYFILSWNPRVPLMKRLAYTAGLSVALFAVGEAVQKSLPSTHSYPACVLMMSDIKNTAILCGDTGMMEQVEKETGLLCKERSRVCPEYSAVGCRGLDKERWDILKKSYVGIVLNHPKEWALSRGIQLVQFVCDGYVPVPMRKVIAAWCPQAKLAEEVWSWRPLARLSSGGRYEKIWLGLAVVLCLAYGRKHGESRELRLANCFAWVGIAYFASFVLMTPTPDTRYHSLFVMASGLCICLYLGYVVRHALVPQWRKMQRHPRVEGSVVQP